MQSRIRSWPRCDEFLNSKAKNPSGPRFVLGKHERLALNVNATFLSCVVTSISPAMLLFLASGWIFQLRSRSLKSDFSGKVISFNVWVFLSFWDNFTHIFIRFMGIYIQTLTDHLCNPLFGLSSGERRFWASCGRRVMNVRASENTRTIPVCIFMMRVCSIKIPTQKTNTIF